MYCIVPVFDISLTCQTNKDNQKHKVMKNNNTSAVNLNQVAQTVKTLVTGIRVEPATQRQISAADVWNIQRQFRGMSARRTQW